VYFVVIVLREYMSLFPMIEVANNGPLETPARVEVRSRDVSEKLIVPSSD
jgi:hypothetical protein